MRILIFGPNGSGKGTQGAIVQKKFGIPHVESGVIFRDHIRKGTELGKKAKASIDRGELVPDSITIPMILARLQEPDCRKGFLLDGFPRNLPQAQALDLALGEVGMALDYVIEIVLPRNDAKKRIMGRRLCAKDNNHPNNVYIPAIEPKKTGGKLVCRVCGGDLMTRADDQDEAAIDKRHDIYYDSKSGTLAAVGYFEKKAGPDAPEIVQVDGRPGVEEVSRSLLEKLAT
ncbi:MAG: adenylate kinase [Planctomycetes bacterium]|nr:adenylate kinase [Planctomycetota bacterium]